MLFVGRWNQNLSRLPKQSKITTCFNACSFEILRRKKIQIQIGHFSSCSHGIFKAKTKHKSIFRLGPIKALLVYLRSPFPHLQHFSFGFTPRGLKSCPFIGGGRRSLIIKPIHSKCNKVTNFFFLYNFKH